MTVKKFRFLSSLPRIHAEYETNSMKRIKIHAKELFLTIRYVDCPAFPCEKIVFNAKGLHHLFYRRRIKVIVRQVGNGVKHFWSVIPGWRKIRGAVRNARGDLSRQ